MKKKIAVLLIMILTLISVNAGMSVSSYAVDGSCTITVSENIDTLEVARGASGRLDLDEIFTDSDGHSLSYSVTEADGSLKAREENGILKIDPLQLGDFDVKVTAECQAGDKTAQAVIPVRVVVPADDGDPLQYGYDETPQESVLVYANFSNDGVPLRGNDEDSTMLAHAVVEIPYFDLQLYGLEGYYRYHTADGRSPYVDSELIERPTALHFMIYMTERYYMGLPEDKCGTGTSGVLDYDQACNMKNLFGNDAYRAEGKALDIDPTQGALEFFMTSLWGHDLNLMYYRNHMYPLQSPGWGATADFMLLSDGDAMDVAFFTNYGFFGDGAFCSFDKEDYVVNQGETFEFKTRSTPASAVSNSGSGAIKPVEDLFIDIYDEEWELVDTIDGLGKSEFQFSFDEEGIYHLVGYDANCETSNANMAPATADVYVEKAEIDDNKAPKRKDGVPESASAAVREQKPYALSMADLFFDPDDDDMTYTVKINDGNPQQIGPEYTFTPQEAGSYTLVFTPTDSKGLAGETYTVALTASANHSPAYADSSKTSSSDTILYNQRALLDVTELFADEDEGDEDNFSYFVSKDGGQFENFEPELGMYFMYSPQVIQEIGTHVFKIKVEDDLGAASDAYMFTVEVDMSEGEKVERLIDDIGEVTLEKEDKIIAARTAYNDLSDEDRAAVPMNYPIKLLEAELRLQELKREKAEQELKQVNSELERIALELEQAALEVARLNARANKVTGLKAKAKSKRFTVSWKKNAGAEGFDVQYKLSKAKKFSKVKYGVKGTSIKSKKLKKGRKYVFRVRTFKTVDGEKIYGPWVKTKAVKCR